MNDKAMLKADFASAFPQNGVRGGRQFPMHPNIFISLGGKSTLAFDRPRMIGATIAHAEIFPF